jgi:hypothetical protein
VSNTARTITLPDSTSTLATTTNFTSTGIDDNADATAITIDSSENVGIGTTSVANAASWGTVLQLGDSTSCAFSLKDTGGKQFDIGTSADSLYLGYDATSGAHRLSLTDSQVKIHTGDLLFGTAGKGIVLGATSNVAANTLDDYEEGTWTPTAGGGLTGLTATDCFYTKIGDIVHLQGRVNAFTGINSNTLWFGGIPFQATHSTSSGIASVTFVDLDQGYQLWLYMAHDESKIYIRYMVDNAQYASLSGSDVSSGSNIHFNVTYKTN